MASSKTRDPWQQQQQNRLRFTTISRENINDMQVERHNLCVHEKANEIEVCGRREREKKKHIRNIISLRIVMR